MPTTIAKAPITARIRMKVSNAFAGPANMGLKANFGQWPGFPVPALYPATGPSDAGPHHVPLRFGGALPRRCPSHRSVDRHGRDRSRSGRERRLLAQLGAPEFL